MSLPTGPVPVEAVIECFEHHNTKTMRHAWVRPVDDPHCQPDSEGHNRDAQHRDDEFADASASIYHDHVFHAGILSALASSLGWAKPERQTRADLDQEITKETENWHSPLFAP